MGRYLLRRLVTLPLVLLVIVTLSFFIVRMAPGGPFVAERNYPPEVVASLNAKYGLDKPLHEQYLRYMGGVVRGDLGPSSKFKDRTVNEIIATHVGPSLVLGTLATALALTLGLLAGILGAVRQNSWLDHGTMSLAMFGMSIPNFVTGPLLVLLFALYWKLLPVAGYQALEWRGLWWLTLPYVPYAAWRYALAARARARGAGGVDPGQEIGAFWLATLLFAGLAVVVVLVRMPMLVLPTVVLALPFASRIARLMRAGMLEVIHQDYIRTARAKGLTETTVVVRHALKGGLLPVVSFMGPAIAALVTGSLVVEQIFAVPGIGREFVQSALNRDYWTALGTVVLYGTLLVVMNLVVDVVYGFLDPRIRYD